MCRKIAQNTANSANRQLKINLNRQIKQLASTFKNKFKEQNSMMQNLLANNETGVMQPKVSLNLEQSLSKIVEDLATNKGLITKTIDKDSFWQYFKKSFLTHAKDFFKVVYNLRKNYQKVFFNLRKKY